MKKLILHVGMPKTATSTVQDAFLRNSKNLCKRGLLYPEIGVFSGQAAHHALVISFLDEQHRKYLRTPFSEAPQEMRLQCEQIRSALSKSGADVALLSSEVLWNPQAFDESMLLKLKAQFEDFDIRILAGIRSIPSHARSSYTQRLTGPQMYTGSFAKHVKECRHNGMWDYAGRLSVFRTVFGHDAVSVFWYEDVKQDIFRPFLTLIGNTGLSLSPLADKSDNLNRSVGWDKTEAQLIDNRMAQYPVPVLARRIVGKAFLLKGFVENKIRQTGPSSRKTNDLLQQFQNEQSELVNAQFDCHWF